METDLARRAWAALVCGLLLASCSIPTQPPPLPPANATVSAAPVSGLASAAAGAAQTATVSGTGRFGLSIRKAPGLSAERIATVPDGFQASIVAGPVGQDGADWYQLHGPDVDGWASAAYLTIGRGTATSRPATPVSSAPATAPPVTAPLSTPLSGILSQVNRESNYDVGGHGIFVEQPLKPAVDHLSASPTAAALLTRSAPAYIRLTIGHFAATSEGGEFSTLGHSIKIADSIAVESLDVQSTVIAHELQHAVDILVDHATPESSQDCVNLELHAFQTEEKVWLELTKPSPPKTRMEGELDSLSHVVNNPTFADQLGKLYAGECGTYDGGKRQ